MKCGALGLLAALLALGGCSAPVFERLADADPLVREEALRELGEEAAEEAPGTPLQARARQEALRGAGDEAAIVRLAAVQVLARLGGPEAATALAQRLGEDEHIFVRLVAAQSLGVIGGEEAVTALCGALRRDPDRNVRFTAARELGRLRSPQSVGPLVEALSDATVDVAFHAHRALVATVGENHGNTVEAWRSWYGQRGE